MDVILIGTSYTLSDREHDLVVYRIRPCLKIGTVNPNDIRNVFVTVAKISPKGSRLLWTIRFEGGEPALCLDRIEQDRDTVLPCYGKHVIYPPKVRGVRRRNITGNCKWRNTVKCGSIRIA